MAKPKRNETTRLPQEYTRAYGCEELHAVCLQHCSDRGDPAHCVTVEIAEAEDDFDRAMLEAKTLAARVLLVCDTRAEVHKVARRALRALPEHRRVSLERAKAGGWGLS